jgi:hypothetical protein
VVELVGSTTGQALAHEVGHYLGLSHVTSDATNLMFPTIPNGGLLTTTQGNTMRSHCFIENRYGYAFSVSGGESIGEDII